jgi:hypothetical protein
MREGLTKLNEQGGTQQLDSVNAATTKGSRSRGGGQLPASHDTTSQSVHSKSRKFKFKSWLHIPFLGAGGYYEKFLICNTV